MGSSGEGGERLDPLSGGRTEPSFCDRTVRDDIQPRTRKGWMFLPVYQQAARVPATQQPPARVRAHTRNLFLNFSDTRLAHGQDISFYSCLAVPAQRLLTTCLQPPDRKWPQWQQQRSRSNRASYKSYRQFSWPLHAHGEPAAHLPV